MAEKLIINASAAACAAGGETTAAWTVAESTGAPTDAEVAAILNVDKFAVMQTGATAAEKAAVAFCILDSLVSTIDLSSAEKRRLLKLKRGLQEYYDLLAVCPE